MSEIDDGRHNFCETCGVERPGVQFCPECGDAVVDDDQLTDSEPCADCTQLVTEKQELRDKLRGAYLVIADQQQRLEADARNMRAARRQLELFQQNGIRERLTVALALLDESVEARSEAWFDFTEQRGQ
ncbi:hypothetical protein [Mycolicibacterium gilvum]|uniref:hypothetical protein n=1 Tax=Mycolicibacterium gilvum TaxID=1804 RepID=UPI004046756D